MGSLKIGARGMGYCRSTTASVKQVAALTAECLVGKVPYLTVSTVQVLVKVRSSLGDYLNKRNQFPLAGEKAIIASRRSR